ncbi:MAG: leucine-rich repeat protein [Firmicutes bacterium]|nr:leucine-rich repeat protein [Bacillota bacterium]
METINIQKKGKLSKKLIMLILPLLLVVAAIFGVMTSQNTIAFASGQDAPTELFAEQRVTSRVSLEDSFCDNTIIVTLTGQATRQFLQYTPESFPEIDAVFVSDLTAATVGYAQREITGNSSLFAEEQVQPMGMSIMSGQSVQNISMLTDTEVFRRILLIGLTQHCRQNVLSSIRILEQRSDILAAEVNLLIEPPSREPNDPGFTNRNFAPVDHWALRNMSLPGAWSFTTGSSAVVVGVIDTGINFIGDLANRRDSRANVHRHFLTANAALGTVEVPQDVDVTATRNGHGTQTASIIGAAGNTGAGMTGINWDVRMASLRVYNPPTAQNPWAGGNVGGLIRAINFAASVNMPIIYMGFQAERVHMGNNQATGLRTAMNAYTGLKISAAGNHGNNIDIEQVNLTGGAPSFPASIRNNRHIAVGAIDRNGNRAVWAGGQSSNFGAQSVHVWAYGANGVLSINAHGNFAGFGGTSAAGPLVTGVAALLLSIDLTLTPQQIKAAILNNVDDLPNINGISVTDGRVNAHRAAASLAFRTTNIGANNIRIDGLRHGFTLPANTSLNIPERINGRNVTEIGASAFANQTFLSTITLPSTVTHIAGNAFLDTNIDWKNLLFAVSNSGETIMGTNYILTDEVYVPHGVTEIGVRAFQNNNYVTEISIPSTVTNIGSNAFVNMHVHIIFAEGRTEIQAGLLRNQHGIAYVEIPNTVVLIGNNAFQRSVRDNIIPKIIIPYSVTTIESNAFQGWLPEQTIFIEGRYRTPSGFCLTWSGNATVELELTGFFLHRIHFQMFEGVFLMPLFIGRPILPPPGADVVTGIIEFYSSNPYQYGPLGLFSKFNGQTINIWSGFFSGGMLGASINSLHFHGGRSVSAMFNSIVLFYSSSTHMQYLSYSIYSLFI